MNRVAKIALLKSWNVAIPSGATNARLDELITANRKETREVKNKGTKLTVVFDKADETPVEVMVYEDIGENPFDGSGFTAKDFMDATDGIPRTRDLDVRINSAGGLVWEGLAIKSRFDEWTGRKTACIDGMAASVASWLPMSFDEIRAPRHAQMFIHDAYGMFVANADEARSQADDLDKTSNQIAEMYARRTGMTTADCRALMKANTLMTGEEALRKGFIDKLTDDEPVSNFSEKQISNMKGSITALWNQIGLHSQEQTNNTNKNMNRKQMEFLANQLGLKFDPNIKDDALNKLLTDKFNVKAKFKNGKDGDHSDDCDCADCSGSKNAPKPAAEKPDADADDGAPGDSELFKKATENMAKTQARMENFLARERTKTITNALDKFVEQGRIPANQLNDWLAQAVGAQENAENGNPVLNLIEKLPVNLPGTEPLNHVIELGESDSIVDLDRNVTNLLKPGAYLSRNKRGPENLSERIKLGENSKNVQRLINRLKKFNGKTSRGMIAPLDEARGGSPMTGPLREAWDAWAAGSPRNANTMSSQLLRQVILSEVMRAFRRQFASLEIFAHNFQSVPLEGTDYVEVPYYPLDKVPSSEFTYAQGYQIAANAQTLYKQIFVGGIGNGVATPGSGRKYKPLQFSAYEIRRQPWLDIQKLSVMAGEQLAIDVRGDIMGSQINAANFANSIWTGAPNGFDHTVVGNVLLQAAIQAFWPLQGRNVVLAPGYYTNLAIDPGITPLLAIGTTDVLREGIVGGLYGFENIIHDPLVPVQNFIRGGDGAATPGTDPFSAGFMAYPSAVLIATAPIMPPPGVLKKLVSYEQITDDQTGLAFTYQFWGSEKDNVDNEIIECTYGSGLGELAALFRLTSQGN